MNKERKSWLPLLTKHAVHAVPFAVGMLLFATPATAADELARSVYTVQQAQQKQQVTGRVTDASGEPLIGVSVTVKGAKGAGAITDIDGRYTIQAAPGATLTFSYVGYTATTKTVGASRTVDVTLAEDSEMLSDVVVIGYGTVKKADLAGSVSVMDSKAFRDQPITQASDALQGRMAGVSVVSDGIPGGSVKIRVRGNNSINKSNDPLYVVDGMVRESGLEGINPEDIQSMQVLKDASSTAIYGSRGANGVVIVTTKTGMKGESRITLDASWGFSNATRLPERLGTKEYARALVDYAGVSEAAVKDYLDGTNPGIDWEDTMFRTGLTQNYKLVFAKGAEGLQTYISGNYMKHEGTIKNSEYQRYAAKANVKAKMTDWLNVTFDLNASRGIGKGIGGLEMNGSNPMWVSFNYSPTMEMFDENGNYNTDPYGSIQENPYGMIDASKSERRHDVLNGRIDLQFNIAKGLTFTTTNGIDYYNNTSYGFSPSRMKAGNSNSMSNSNNQRVMLQTTNNLTYVGSWGDHHLTATGVWEATKSETRAMGISGQNLQTETVGWWNVSNAKSRDASNSYSSWALLSGVGRVMYNYADRYMLTATFRADGTSRLTNNKWGYFPSVAAAWTVTNEKFMESTKDWLSSLKIRASYGIIGNQDISPYSTLALLSTSSTYYGGTSGVTGYYDSSIATPDLKWEKTKQFDLGFDFGFLNNRIELTVDYFNKKTTDALLSTNLAGYLGGVGYMVNAGEVANSGVDISLNARVIETKDWLWTTTINGSYLKNEVKKLTAQQPILYGGSFASILTESTIVKEGEALGSFYGHEWAGIGQAGQTIDGKDVAGYDLYYTKDGQLTTNPGTDDRKVLGKSTPDFTLGWNNTVSYKNWTLNAFFNAAFGVQRLNALRFAMSSMIGNSRMITSADALAEIGKTMPDPRVENNNYIGASSKWVENADYFRCENVTLSYDLKKDVTKFADIRLSFSVQNLFTLTGYKGSDPAGFNFSSGEGDRSTGLDTGSYPAPRTFTFGVRMNF